MSSRTLSAEIQMRMLFCLQGANVLLAGPLTAGRTPELFLADFGLARPNVTVIDEYNQG